ncbi:hypothetical protein [Pseudogulbenkiania ferrooxidans]|uniref:Uncharacterized protein n=1 Tax=Pseudogulbenkiania ferrooxidans EGD-HP2 TaxID=1388764 RepID=A0ABN0NA43_9NEIS|nr:hypothetical protein [Pseudogulbenkiania ferrooxidans]ERE16303.1 hypothetical protein O166_03660 [Pseudogulbenkiania ferrooxidans EGD-HP2]
MAGMLIRRRGGCGTERGSAVLDAAVARAACYVAKLDERGQKMLHHGFLCRFVAALGLARALFGVNVNDNGIY